MWGLAGGGVWALQWTRHMVDNTKKVQKKVLLAGIEPKRRAAYRRIIFHSATNATLVYVRICIYKAFLNVIPVAITLIFPHLPEIPTPLAPAEASCLVLANGHRLAALRRRVEGPN